MISVEEAINLVLSQEVTCKSVVKNTIDALGEVVSESVYAPIALPTFPQSAMDGYAVKGFQKEFILKGEIQAGASKDISLEEGTAIRIFTGGAVPSNATCVIMQEKVVNVNDLISINDEILEGKNIRPIGEQVKKGQLIFEKGTLLNASAIGLLVSLGIEKVEVFSLPKISLVSTGNELVELGKPLEYGQVYESNSATLINAAKSYNYTISSFHKVDDEYNATKKTLEETLNITDVLLVSGGISVGDYDFVGTALNEIGVEKIFYKIAQKPGKPLFFGKKGNKYIFALPGNPAAALTCFYMYVLPLLNKISGKPTIQLEKVKLPILKELQNKAPLSLFLKAKANRNGVTILDGQASSMLFSYSFANALVYIPSQIDSVEKNEEVEVFLL